MTVLNVNELQGNSNHVMEMRPAWNGDIPIWHRATILCNQQHFRNENTKVASEDSWNNHWSHSELIFWNIINPASDSVHQALCVPILPRRKTAVSASRSHAPPWHCGRVNPDPSDFPRQCRYRWCRILDASRNAFFSFNQRVVSGAELRRSCRVTTGSCTQCGRVSPRDSHTGLRALTQWFVVCIQRY